MGCTGTIITTGLMIGEHSRGLGEQAEAVRGLDCGFLCEPKKFRPTSTPEVE